ncbi:MAG TPA: STING domain-containing protein [Vineibacter sp.]|nr:STING domain-containing protein [Vineibacter sp.]
MKAPQPGASPASLPPGPRVFIGSSTEALALAHQIKAALAPEIAADVWDDDIFELGEGDLDNLIGFARQYDFALMVFNADDKVLSRRQRQHAPRDNVIFELGLFIGALGRRRALAVLAPGKANKLKIPSDLLGTSKMLLDGKKLDGFDSARKADAARRKAARRYLAGRIDTIKRTILARVGEAGLSLLPSTGLAIGYFNNFLKPVCEWIERNKKITIDAVEHDISHDNYDFTVAIPRTLSAASVDGQRRFAEKNNLKPSTIKGENRSYPFFVNAEMKGGRLQLVDYPTTLRASYDTIQLVLASGALKPITGEETLLEEKELRNFHRVLENLLARQEPGSFKENVHIVHV